jgi:pimeloyl-ACP methyl ester carboxylesterase
MVTAAETPVNDARQLLGYDDIGEGPALVLVHGLTFTRRTWDPIVARLRDSFRCIAVDLPGHGDSDGSGADPEAICDRLNQTLGALSVERPFVLGHSAGALLVTAYAATSPTTAVVNIDQPLLVAPFAARLQQLAGQLRGPGFRTAFAPFEEGIGVAGLPEPERTRVAKTRPIDQVTVLDHWQLPLTRHPGVLQTELDAVLDAVPVPYLYLAGDEPGAEVRRHLRAHLPQLEVVVWPDRGHLVHLTEPSRFADVVRDLAARTA